MIFFTDFLNTGDSEFFLYCYQLWETFIRSVLPINDRLINDIQAPDKRISIHTPDVIALSDDNVDDK